MKTMTPVADHTEDSVRGQVPAAALADAAIAAYVPGAKESPVATPKFRKLLTELMETPARLVGDEWSELAAVEILSAGFRSVVVRLVSARGGSLVAKFYRRQDSATNSGGFGFAREVAGLRSLGAAVPGLPARLIAADADSRICLVEDLSPAGAVSAPLHRAFLDAGSLESALATYERIWEHIYVQPAGTGQSFCTALAAVDPHATRPGSLASPQLALKGWERLASTHRLEPATGQKALNRVITSTALLTPGDFGPHNILLVDGTPRLFDAEGTAAHHRLLPVADLILGFPLAPHHEHYLPLVDTAVWQDAATRLLTVAQTSTAPGTGHLSTPNLTDRDLTDALLYTACTALELWDYTPNTPADTRTHALLTRLRALTPYLP